MVMIKEMLFYSTLLSILFFIFSLKIEDFEKYKKEYIITSIIPGILFGALITLMLGFITSIILYSAI